MTRRLLAAFAAFALPASAALAGDGFEGSWTIAAAEAAPWAAETGPSPFDAALLGRTVAIAADGVRGPELFGCGGAPARQGLGGAESLFDGALDDPGRQALALGVAPGSIVPALATGCAAEIVLYRIGPDRAVFAFAGRIYTLARAAAEDPVVAAAGETGAPLN
ncbi:hypothetical protein [Prosthecomicrobium pneumaticum]|uniref:Alkaline proteinase inhibitor/ Outer membrane lipoprotein Omp19 domain-containing protein n=1 Tax=Prosthecomicrobium pneumaticum TaxID=81895 RepID=A0A7W9L3Z6_9HYPH|nr:hypothetical protein [Prosthecomicrobium pneumaticum]MBB5755061.1 hypothetical protein [Prosthecomicrobium pneumaticum]